MRISDWSSDVCSSDLIRPHLPALAVRDQCVALERGLDLGRQRLGIGGRCTVAARLAMHLGDLAQHRYREQVRRDQERIQTRIIRRPEHRMDQPDLLCRPAITAEHQAVGRVLRLALEMIRPRPVLALRSEEHTSELQSLMRISYVVFCLKKKYLISS